MDLIKEPWLPVIRVDGTKTKIPLIELLDNAVLDTAYLRADFQNASWQMLAGLLQCTVAPEDDDDWEEIWNDGIDPNDWQDGLQAVSSAFQFGAEKPSFLQSYDALGSEYGSIAGLLIDAPGENALKHNKDHFIKRRSVERICPDCAVMALFTVQTNSPAGGAGYRVGMRGGGPLTTLVMPMAGQHVPLWKKLWLNVITQTKEPTSEKLTQIFPWLGPTRTSEKAGNVITPENAHPLQAYWGMPRRIEIDFAHTDAGNCDLCGEHHQALLLQMRSKNYGVQYDGWLHPFSPYRQALKDPSSPWLALKGQPGGLCYKDWLGILLEGEDKFNRTLPAKVVRAATERANILACGLWCSAYDMDNAKARCWYQHRIPLIDTSRADLLQAVMQQVVSLASDSLSLLRNALRSAWFANPKEATVDFGTVNTAFWQETEPAFLSLLVILAGDPQRKNAASCQALRQWEMQLHTYLLEVFDRNALTDVDCPSDILSRRLVARRILDGAYCKQKTRKDVLLLGEEQKEKQHA
ncbi:type I-E CRISPR-associated protein Cse1/CasA [Martelella alba]|uniref:Type I-E CRISPR-associated protein Cse1/CasA n=1 Tax=Martelella alba TaxID=2590451 RepID=A0ABY2SHI4_9HYPH|nr:type I-E CRISPR-associated protein Cse1/CasA [Martelella alba]TKI04082.1 type I-E CRISPR-associated protein Cse1/CasA [Martelella alba]